MNRGLSTGLFALHLVAATVCLGHLAVILGWPMLSGTHGGNPLHAYFALLCHQIPSRCWWIGSEPMPVCARCLGMWIGQLLAAGTAVLCGGRVAWWRWRWAVVLVGIAAGSWLGGRCGLPESWHCERLITGIGGGVGIYILFTLGLTVLARRLPTIRRMALSGSHAAWASLFTLE